MADLIAQLKELKALLDAGVLSPEQFEMGKLKLLSAETDSTKKSVKDPKESNQLSDVDSESKESLIGTTGMDTSDWETTDPSVDVAGLESVDSEATDVLEGSTRMAPSSASSVEALGGATRMAGAANPLGGATRMAGAANPLGGATRMAGSGSAGKSVAGALGAGTVFDDRYSIVTVLGEGGMGMVYQAIDTRLNQTVALKTLRSEIARDPEMVKLLSQEVSLAQRLNHPNLLGIRHLEVKARTPYVVMELMDGGDLDELLASKGGRLGTDEALRMMHQVLSGLSALHEERIAHLDVKPQNVLLSSKGVAKLADFGISSRLRDQRGEKLVAGTPEYSPPEQLSGAACDVRADVYAAGIMFHQLLVGGFPFDRTAGLAAVRAWHDSGRRLFPDLDPGLGKVVAKATAIDPDQRYRTAAEMAEALSRAISRRPWFPVSSARVRSNELPFHDQILLPDGTMRPCSDPAVLLRQGLAWPSGRLRSGALVLETDPLALIHGGRAAPEEFEDDVLTGEVLESLFGGDGLKVAMLESLGTPRDASLAIAAYLTNKPELAVRRLTKAKASAQTTSDRLCIVRALLTGLGDVVEAKTTLREVTARHRSAEMDAISRVEGQLEISRIWHWLIGDSMRAEETLLEVEQVIEGMPSDERFEIALCCVQTSSMIRAVDYRNHDGAMARILVGFVTLDTYGHVGNRIRLLDCLGPLWVADLEGELGTILEWSRGWIDQIDQRPSVSYVADLQLLFELEDRASSPSELPGTEPILTAPDVSADLEMQSGALASWEPEPPLRTVDVVAYFELMAVYRRVVELNEKNRFFDLSPVSDLNSWSEELTQSIEERGYSEALKVFCVQLHTSIRKADETIVNQKSFAEKLKIRKAKGLEQCPSSEMNPPQGQFGPPPYPTLPLNSEKVAVYDMAWSDIERRSLSYITLWKHQQRVHKDTGAIFDFSDCALDSDGVAAFKLRTKRQLNVQWELNKVARIGHWVLCPPPKPPYETGALSTYKKKIYGRLTSVVLFPLVVLFINSYLQNRTEECVSECMDSFGVPPIVWHGEALTDEQEDGFARGGMWEEQEDCLLDGIEGFVERELDSLDCQDLREDPITRLCMNAVIEDYSACVYASHGGCPPSHVTELEDCHDRLEWCATFIYSQTGDLSSCADLPNRADSIIGRLEDEHIGRCALASAYLRPSMAVLHPEAPEVLEECREDYGDCAMECKGG